MSDRHFDDMRRSVARSIRFAAASSKLRLLPTWCYVSLGVNIALVSLLAMAGLRNPQTTALSAQPLEPTLDTTTSDPPGSGSPPILISDEDKSDSLQLGPRHQLEYREWLDILAREADAVAANPPEHLSILLGDSISLWFPHDLLPLNTTWLNQGISGEGSAGLLRRLELIADTNPDVIFVMIGINDLIRDVDDETLLANQQALIRDLKDTHPDATIVVQSILPHAGDRATWESKDRLVEIPNTHIQELNEQLRAIATAEDVEFLNLYPLFSDAQGNMRLDLSSDGLHLNDDGYRVWASALQLYSQLAFE